VCLSLYFRVKDIKNTILPSSEEKNSSSFEENLMLAFPHETFSRAVEGLSISKGKGGARDNMWYILLQGLNVIAFLGFTLVYENRAGLVCKGPRIKKKGEISEEDEEEK
jgi:hypothetical protein